MNKKRKLSCLKACAFFVFIIFTYSSYSCEEANDEVLPVITFQERPPEASLTGSVAQLPKITVDKFMGANAFVDDPLDKLKAVGFIREYHKWNWDEGAIGGSKGNLNYPGYPANQIKWAPSEISAWNFDEFYSKVKGAGLEIAPVLQGSPCWLQGRKDFPFSSKPLDEPSADSRNPNSYEAKAHYMFQFAARYGAQQVADNLLTLASGQPRNSGLRLVQYVEDWNEQDATWAGEAAKFSPQEYAAMASADYDGHANTMKQGSGTFGVKNADPNMKLVMGGLAFLNLDYVKQMLNWFTYNRPDKKFAADVINVHHYAWLKESETWRGGGPAKSPEDDRFRERMKAWADYRNMFLPGVEIWVSEFGWDTHPQSPLRPPVIGPFDIQEVQGQWMVRGFLALIAAGVDRAQMYMLRDVDPTSPTQYNTCGLTGPKGDWTPKKSWYYVSTMKNTLANMTFLGEVSSGDPNILIYKFKNIANDGGAYAVWAKTSKNYNVTGYKLKLTSTPAVAAKVEMVVGDADGVTSSLNISSNQVSINVSERPIFVLVDKIQ